MANFLRDQHITNIFIDENAIKQLSELFQKRMETFNASIPNQSDEKKRANFFCIIRFDGKGYRIFSVEHLLHYFRQAKKIERIIFTLETGESLISNRRTGMCMELRLDQKDSNNCALSVASDDEDWVNSSFALVQDTLAQCKNKYGLMRTDWTPLGIQIVGVLFGFLICLWAAIKISPKLLIQNSFVISFFFFFIVFSNMWTYLNGVIMRFVNNLFPNVMFYRHNKDRIHWIIQTIIGGFALAITLWVLHIVFSYFGSIFNSMVIKNS